jgi:suppressor for copper-sensitivity B
MGYYASYFFSKLKISLLLLMIFCVSCLAEEGSKAKLSLISESTAVGGDATILLGLRAQIAPGWKTYWRSPGIAGYGVNLAWEGSKNIKSARLLWPLPHRSQTQLGPVNAYEGDLVFPILVELIDPTQPVQAHLEVDMLICDEVNCLPVMETLRLDLPAGVKTMSAQAPFLQKAMNKVPKLMDPSKHNPMLLKVNQIELIDADEIPPKLQVTVSKPQGNFSASDLPELFFESKGFFVDAPKARLSKDQGSIVYSASVFADEHRKPSILPGLAEQSVTLTIGYQNEGFEVHETIKHAPLSLAFWVGILLIAFLGGLILNVMPCVLPVLSLKVISVMRHGGGHNATVRQEFLATVMGILFSFLLLAMGAIFLKVSGRAVGWGVQFQEPYFLIALIGILTLFACNLFGFFEFRLPAMFSSMGSIPAHRQSLIGSFLEGSLVTVLATPCTAPFLGTALAFALARGPADILTIFLMLGLGLAFPFLLIAFIPKLATRLPKPGAWMVTVKYGLGFVIILTAIWLVYVLIAEIGQTGALIVAVMMLLISLVLKNNQNGSEVRKKMAWIGASLLIAASFTLPSFVTKLPAVIPSKNSLVWKPFEPDLISGYVKEGKAVFVSVTADWCLTCQANKYFILHSKVVLAALRDKDVVVMEADWTNHDPKITSYLKSFNQYGIPFYAVYGCKTPSGKFLGQILTTPKVLDALKKEKCVAGKLIESAS